MGQLFKESPEAPDAGVVDDVEGVVEEERRV
jgi:hypothetical protein